MIEKTNVDIELNFMQVESSVGTTQFIHQNDAWYIAMGSPPSELCHATGKSPDNIRSTMAKNRTTDQPWSS